MDGLIDEIRRALQAKLYAVSLQTTLALIDICGGLDAPNGRSTGKTFTAWFKKYVSPTYEDFSPDDAYRLRCGMLHQGKAHADQYAAVLFILPNPFFQIHRSIADDTYLLDLDTFCTDILDVVEAWWATNRHREPVRTNSEALVAVRPEGLSPFIVGSPVLG